MVCGSHPEYLLGKRLAIDEDEWILVVDHFYLRPLREGTRGDENADPAPAKASYDPGNLVRTDG